MTLYSTPGVIQLTGATLRQLNHWDAVGIVCPARRATGSGSQRGYAAEQLPVIRALVALRTLGAPLQALARAGDELAVLAADQWQGIVYVTPAGDVWSWWPGGHAWVLDLGLIGAMPGPVSLDCAHSSP